MKSIYKLMLAAAAVPFIAACGGGDDSLDDRLDIADPKVRFVHAATLSPAVTLYRNNVAQADATNVSYRSASNYYDVSVGTANWRVATAAGNVEVGNFDLNTTRGNKFTIVAIPNLAITGAELLLIEDPYNKGLTSNNARVRVLHAAANSPVPVDVYLVPAGTNLNNVSPGFASVAYKSAQPTSGNDSVDINGGSYELNITAAGSKTALFRAPVALNNNADWLVTVLPDSVVPGDLRVLIVQSDNAAATQEIANTL
jgi:hypothetical protein